MRLDYGIVKFDYLAIRKVRVYAVWAYDLDKPRKQPDWLPQGTVVDLIGVYRTTAQAFDALKAARRKAPTP